MPTITKLISMKEAAEHNTRDDCWLVIDGKVYDVTKYLDDHPGGDDVLLEATGRDSTEDFEDAGHSKTARELMQDYFVGELETSPVIPELEIFKKNKSSTFVDKLLSKTSEYWTYPAAIIGVSAVVGIVLYTRKRGDENWYNSSLGHNLLQFKMIPS